jgi:hypothetical protein
MPAIGNSRSTCLACAGTDWGESKGVLYLKWGRLSHRQQSKIWQLAGVSSDASAPAPPARAMAVVD